MMTDEIADGANERAIVATIGGTASGIFDDALSPGHTLSEQPSAEKVAR